MGGEDWEAWTDLLLAEGLMAPGCLNLAYSYIGPEVTWPIYRNGTIGKAKEHLENSAAAITEKMKLAGCGDAFVSVNKAVVTQASSAIPVVPLSFPCFSRSWRNWGLMRVASSKPAVFLATVCTARRKKFRSMIKIESAWMTGKWSRKCRGESSSFGPGLYG